MAQVFELIYVVFAVLLLFGAAIAIHEWGHYWVALKRGLKVEAFAIGFGPKIWGWTKDGIEYSIRWIPAGGYVKLPQMLTSEALEGEQKGDPLPPVSPISKILVAVAGPFMNFVFACAIATFIYFVGLPVPVNPSVIGHVAPDSAEHKLGIRNGDRIVSVNGQAVKSWSEVFEATILAPTNVIPVILEHAGERKNYQLTASSDNPLKLKMLNLDSEEKVVVGDTSPGSPAAEAKVLAGDVIIGFAGVPVVGKAQLIDLVGKRGGQATELIVERAGKRVTLNLTPRVLDAGAKKARIGIAFANTPTRYEVQKPGPLPWVQIEEVWDRTWRTMNALFHSKETGVGIEDLSGPPGILAMLASYVKTDYRLALSFMVLLNINLAVLNLFPIPVLDGGHIMMAIYERLRGKPISVKLQEYATTAFAVMLLTFMAYVSFNDLWKRSSLFKSMFQQSSQIDPAPAPSPAK
ncbi:MAG: RIP metalloprotease RseP [Verrucomicrobia bacterium]|nr:RIP metalloprotease RseP [Verrucomicrobiota bacterium]NBU08440.1 RIP metalloprotease RseP [Pseudomonadota bacterium]NDA65567.1 RIP metalloprotease RseP [Verrucomicrobiota bacterium]NDB75169.1 RIP metalloprotease RseP [Verrucomicrobiota bacterium]NDD37464.1 RIP metalloprotease RseP [Verrucomicrobiota bacterium]